MASSKSVSVVGVNPPSDIASGRIAEMRRRSMSCIAWRASRSKNAEAFLKYYIIVMLGGIPKWWYLRIVSHNAFPHLRFTSIGVKHMPLIHTFYPLFIYYSTFMSMLRFTPWYHYIFLILSAIRSVSSFWIIYSTQNTNQPQLKLVKIYNIIYRYVTWFLCFTWNIMWNNSK